MIKQWMELVDYRITEGLGFQWQCYGDKAYAMVRSKNELK